MKLDVLADLDHLLMINFSVPVEQLASLVPAPMRPLVRNGRSFPSIVLPRIENLRPIKLGFPKVDYELFGLRLLVEYESQQLGRTKGIYFRRLIMDPNAHRLVANVLTPFNFERGHINKNHRADGSIDVNATFASGETAIQIKAQPSDEFPNILPSGSSFSTADEALAMYNDIAFGFLPGSRERVHILQIADPHPNYVAWPLRHLKVCEESLKVHPCLADMDLVVEPCYFVGQLPRYWRWLSTEALMSAPASLSVTSA
jgi:hypothetical protein